MKKFFLCALAPFASFARNKNFVSSSLCALVLKNNSRREFIQEIGSIRIIYKFLLKNLLAFVFHHLCALAPLRALRETKNFVPSSLRDFVLKNNSRREFIQWVQKVGSILRKSHFIIVWCLLSVVCCWNERPI